MDSKNIIALEVVAFTPKKDLTKGEVFQAIRQEMKKYQGKPVVFVFPEAILGEKAITRLEGKAFVTKINQLLAQHGNAFAFFSIIEKIGKPTNARSISNTGYIVTPSRKKPWFVYPKLYRIPEGKGHSLQVYDSTILGKNAPKKSSEVHKLLTRWVARAEKIKGFPQVRINGKDIQLRICSDIHHNYLFDLPVGKSKRKADLVLVPARGLHFEQQHMNYIAPILKKRGVVAIVDGDKAKVNYFAKRKKQNNPLIGTATVKPGININWSTYKFPKRNLRKTR
ncbi:MAG: hypothetical protein WC462_03005 [archaeon]